MAKIKFQTNTGSEMLLEFNTQMEFKGAQFNCYAGGSDYRTAQGIYEADKGFIILQATYIPTSQWGESGYSTMLMGRDGNIEKIEKIIENIEELLKVSSEKNDEKNSNELNWVRKYFFDYYSKITTTNAHFEVNAYAKSRQIEGPFGIVLDTKTGNIEGQFSFIVMKLITPEELSLLNAFFKDSIAKGESVTHSFID